MHLTAKCWLGNSWRYGYDVNDWNSAYSNSIAASSALAEDAGPGGWNDPDALIGTSTTTGKRLLVILCDLCAYSEAIYLVVFL